ncbi:MAG: electron transporter RnfC [Ignavibacteria bacterium RBG_13_36_8]|nr:MAG: electron transporter RnfC [Ignavibacteria bacterium RBG_13_36_8]
MGIFKSAQSFKGGVHPKEYKGLTENLPFEIMPNPLQIILPLTQHLGKPAKPVVQKGDEVKAGMVVAEPDGFISSPVHSSVSGKVSKIFVNANVSGFPKESILVDAIDTNELVKMVELNPEEVTPEEIRERVKAAGIVGQGGAAFPTFVKLTPPPDKKIDYVILNGCECEPYLTRDYRYMLERTDSVVTGLRLIMKALGVERGGIGIEDNKPKAIEKIKKEIENYTDISIVVLKTKYPQGAEKMLIKAAIDREVPPGRLPLDVGVVVQNIGTAVAVYDAIVKGEPQITAAVTVSGGGIKNPKNLIVRVGTPLGDVLEYCGGLLCDAKKVIVGGPMMGVAQHDFTAPIMKATSGIVVLTAKEINDHKETHCLKCGKCVDACPLNLIPTRLARLTQLDRLDEAEQLGVTVCMECGTCTFTCPANVPLVQWIRLGKQSVLQIQRERKTA